VKPVDRLGLAMQRMMDALVKRMRSMPSDEYEGELDERIADVQELLLSAGAKEVTSETTSTSAKSEEENAVAPLGKHRLRDAPASAGLHDGGQRPEHLPHGVQPVGHRHSRKSR